jgi:hypothetical protein
METKGSSRAAGGTWNGGGETAGQAAVEEAGRGRHRRRRRTGRSSIVPDVGPRTTLDGSRRRVRTHSCITDLRSNPVKTLAHSIGLISEKAFALRGSPDKMS